MQEESFTKEISQLTQCDWVKEEFKEALFGDKRLFLRLLVVAKHFAQHPSAPINQASEVWKKTKAAYRFFDNKKVSPKLILKSHYTRTEERIRNHAEIVLVAQDTSFLNFSHMQSSTDLGPIGTLSKSSMGLVMHTSIAFTTLGLPLGLLDQEIWARSIKDYGKSKNRRQLKIEEKESFKWLKALQNYSHESLNEKLVTVCDREADIYEFFVDARRLKAKLLVRACYDRNINVGDSKFKLREFMLEQQIVDTDVVDVPRESRKAKVEIRASYVQLICPDSKQKIFKDDKTMGLYAVYALESNPPQGCQPLSWMLLTNVANAHKRKPKIYVEWYKRRWQIEVFHKILKSGCTVEKARLEKNNRRFPYLALYSVIAWKLLQIVHFARVNPTSNASSILTSTECDVLYSVTHNSLETGHSFNAKKALSWLAQLGGFLARKGDLLPGPTHVWRGWQRLQDFTHMYAITKSYTCG